MSIQLDDADLAWSIFLRHGGNDRAGDGMVAPEENRKCARIKDFPDKTADIRKGHFGIAGHNLSVAAVVSHYKMLECVDPEPSATDD